ncbi:DUF4259 domain-containing protein [Promicromonospora sp. NPDC060204]|uniref:DUF4259 domain-containing protein n=1 Tax=Promicromonospora sp. NPDC060204 TaxID=3347071 RepID=UPI0036482E44
MGTWSTEILGNDSAMDALGALADRQLSFADLADELRGDYIESDAGAAVLALIEVALAARGLRELPQADAVDAARDVLDDERAAWLLEQTDRVLGAGSEVYELWQEASEQSLREWLGKVEASIEDLRQALGSAALVGAAGGGTGD